MTMIIVPYTIPSQNLQICYISGPMPGIQNRAAFMDAEKRLKKLGFSVINPARGSAINNIRTLECREPTWPDYIVRVLEDMKKATHIHYLPGDENSAGCQIEAIAAEKLGLEVVE